MSDGILRYRDAVQAIKTAILQSQYEAARDVNARQLQLYYAVGAYVSRNTRNGAWGSGALKSISEQLQKELPGLRGFSERNMYYMKVFYDTWAPYFEFEETGSFMLEKKEGASSGLEAFPHSRVQKCDTIPIEEFFSLGFTHHRTIIESVKNQKERLFYIRHCAQEHWSVATLKRAIREDKFHHQGSLPNNFSQSIPDDQRALKAIDVFKDEYLLDFINVEELGVRDQQDIDERVLEQGIVHNVKNFIMTFGRGFTFVGSQYHLEAFGEDQYIDLLFFNRDLNCLVAVELKRGPFKTSYLGQLNGYLSILDGFERKPHENPSIGLVLCKDMNKAFVDYVVQDFTKPLGVATYKTSQDMSEDLLNALPPIDALKALLEDGDEE